MKLTHQIQKITDLSSLVTVVLANEDALKLKRDFDDKLISDSHVEGFRKGRAPLNVVIGKIGREEYSRNLKEHIASEALAEALKGSEISPVVKPKYEFADWEEGGKFVFTATIHTEPPDPKDKFITQAPDPFTQTESERYSEPIHGIPGQMPIIDGKLPPHMKGPDVRPQVGDFPKPSPAPVNIPQGDPTAPIHSIPKRPDELLQRPQDAVEKSGEEAN